MTEFFLRLGEGNKQRESTTKPTMESHSSPTHIICTKNTGTTVGEAGCIAIKLRRTPSLRTCVSKEAIQAM